MVIHNRDTVLVELCAGSAALSVWLLGRSKPLTGYAGGKGRWASRIADHLELWSRPSRVILCDPGPWGRVWRDLPEHWEEVAEALEVLAHGDPEAGVPPPHPREVWDLFKGEPVPDDPVRFLVRFLTLQRWNFRQRAVGTLDGIWVTHGYGKTMAEGLAETDGFGAIDPCLPSVARNLRRLAPWLHRIEGHHCSAMDLEPIPGAAAYIDPPYSGTTGYGPHDLSRTQVLELAQRWEQAGCRVALSEAEPLSGYRGIRLGDQSASSGLSGTSEGRVEWLSLSWKDRQLSLL